ncbi:MAG: hypothetical protein A2Y15_09285 [Clostridiales bacterium GWF2_36_10]|nr:MAG: hypothetical protein A2Y15_09285 [Clostridiales bacterium GWF2_36_10]HAN21427.1 hypothetical protein [Clostridiales bacterium]
MKSSKWNKKIFCMLLEQAKGVRSWRQFAADCDISYVQMRKLAQGTQENPPRPKLIHKIAVKAFNEVDLEDLMFAAGVTLSENMAFRAVSQPPAESFYEKYRSLSGKDRRTVNEFVDFLSERRNREETTDGNED